MVVQEKLAAAAQVDRRVVGYLLRATKLHCAIALKHEVSGHCRAGLLNEHEPGPNDSAEEAGRVAQSDRSIKSISLRSGDFHRAASAGGVAVHVDIARS